jgi:predicted TIM-barrel fold metal-dependent hydrolase
VTAGLTRRRVLVRAASVTSLMVTAAHIGSRAAAETQIPIIDAHTHMVRHLGGSRGGARWFGGVEESLSQVVPAALGLMDRFGVTMAILSPPPFPAGREEAYGVPELRTLVREHPDRFAFSAGGESLNPLIQEVAPDRVTPELLARFAGEAEAIAQAGAAAFGELAAEHFSSHQGNHPYESARPDHPFFEALVDIAAKYGMPIELHMEAVPQDMPFPRAAVAGPPNPAYLQENITAFGRLLAHNARARIVWVHAGWDLSGERTVPLMRSLLQAHPNLFMSVKSDPAGTPATAPFLNGGGIKPGWLAMLRAFPERFVIGSDQFYDTPSVRTERARKFVDWLPSDLAPLIAFENVRRIYRLSA